MLARGHPIVFFLLAGVVLVGIQGQGEMTVRGLAPFSGNERKLQMLMCMSTTKRTSPPTTSPPTDAPETTTTTTLPETPTTTTTSSTTVLGSITTFCVVADAPYQYSENLKLIHQVKNMDPECEFVAHLGDIRSARLFDTCVRETYRNASLIMQRSKEPVLMILGDNEWNDCPNHEQALRFWHEEFDSFTNKYWTHEFNITSQPGRIENMYFIHNQALFITLNIVGGRVLDTTEWNNRLQNNFLWTKSLIEKHVRGAQADANAVVILAHATNTPNHRPFFHGMRDYIEFELKNSVPILYLNGDVHSWNEQSNYFDQINWKRVTLDGNAREKPLKVTVDASSGVHTVNDAFSFVRFY